MPTDFAEPLLWVALLIVAAAMAMVRAAVAAADTGSFEKMAQARPGPWSDRVLGAVERPKLLAMAADLWILALCAAVGFRLVSTPWGGVAAVALYVPVVFLFVLLIPRRVGTQRPYGTLKLLFWPVWGLSMILWPLCWLLDKLALPGLKAGPETIETSEEEILELVDKGGESGDIEAGEREMIENIFEMGSLDAEDIMVHRTDMVIIWEEDTEEEILETIRQSGLSRFPVCRENVDDVIGILSTRDYLLNYRLDAPQPLSALLRAAYFVPESVKADTLFREMQRQKVHMAIVVDEYGGTSGLLTMEDLLEQLVGDIYDEFDSEEELEIIQLEPDVWRMRGSVELEQLSEALGLDIPDSEEFDTLGGLIFSGLTAIPEDGSHPEVTLHGLHILVEELQERRVEWARVHKLPQEDAEQP